CLETQDMACCAGALHTWLAHASSVKFRRLSQAFTRHHENVTVWADLKIIVEAIQKLFHFRMADGGLENGLLNVVGGSEIDGFVVRGPDEAPYPLVEVRGEFFDLTCFAIVDAKPEEVRLVSIAGLRRVSDIAAVGRILGRG